MDTTWWEMVLTGHTASQNMQAISHGVFTAMVSKLLIKPASCGQTATQAPHFIQAFHPISNITEGLVCMIKSF
jgi:hypothetical protein